MSAAPCRLFFHSRRNPPLDFGEGRDHGTNFCLIWGRSFQHVLKTFCWNSVLSIISPSSCSCWISQKFALFNISEGCPKWDTLRKVPINLVLNSLDPLCINVDAVYAEKSLCVDTFLDLWKVLRPQHFSLYPLGLRREPACLAKLPAKEGLGFLPCDLPFLSHIFTYASRAGGFRRGWIFSYFSCFRRTSLSISVYFLPNISLT